MTISEVKLKKPPPRRSCGSQTASIKDIQSDESLIKQPPAPPPSPPLPDILDVTVKFYFNEGSVVTRVYNNYTTLAEVKVDLAKRFEVKPELLIIKQFDCELSNECSIYETIDDELGNYHYNLEVSPEAASIGTGHFSDPKYIRKSLLKTLDIDTYNK